MPLLPNELLIHIFALLPLKGLIRARTICVNWRTLVLATPISQTRRELLDFYYFTISSPSFLPTRTRYVSSGCEETITREDFLHFLLAEAPYNPLPESFQMWLEEWPTRAIIADVWPGLWLSENSPRTYETSLTEGCSLGFDCSFRQWNFTFQSKPASSSDVGQNFFTLQNATAPQIWGYNVWSGVYILLGHGEWHGRVIKANIFNDQGHVDLEDEDQGLTWVEFLRKKVEWLDQFAL